MSTLNNYTLTICNPTIIPIDGGKQKLSATILIGSEAKELWIAVENKYAQYLCFERSDAFLVALLPLAMRENLDIICEAPVNERLLCQLRNFLIPLLARHAKVAKEISISASVDSAKISCARAVGAGISCGVDSLHVLKNHSNDLYPSLKVTHLVHNNLGLMDVNSKQFVREMNCVNRFCQDYGCQLLNVDSNIMPTFYTDCARYHTYMNMAMVLGLQKFWGAFYYGSPGIDPQVYFTLRDNDLNDSAHYDLISLNAFSSNTLQIYSEGAAYGRFEKLSHIVDYEPAQKYLQVCVNDGDKNCGKCFKCARTLILLDALGAVDKFSNVFDVEYYKENRHWYLRYLYRMIIRGHDPALREVYAKLKRDITFVDKIVVGITMVRNLLCRFN